MATPLARRRHLHIRQVVSALPAAYRRCSKSHVCVCWVEGNEVGAGAQLFLFGLFKCNEEFNLNHDFAGKSSVSVIVLLMKTAIN